MSTLLAPPLQGLSLWGPRTAVAFQAMAATLLTPWPGWGDRAAKTGMAKHSWTGDVLQEGALGLESGDGIKLPRSPALCILRGA